MTLQDRLEALVQLGEQLQEPDEYREAVIHRSYHTNPWFTKENQRMAFEAIAKSYLAPDKLNQWLGRYVIQMETSPKWIGIIMAGNIPLVGFHDLLCVFISGHRLRIKLSDKDRFLIPYILRALKKIDSRTEAYFEIVEKLNDFDAVIATGSNNSFRYFESYFGKYPNILRKNRNAVAVLDGSETAEDLKELGRDIFQYFGLGCRNVSKLYIPQGYDFTGLLEALHSFKSIIEHPKYKNNFDYNYALLILNKAKYLGNGCILLLEESNIASRIGSLHYEFYQDWGQVNQVLTNEQESIQCIVGKSDQVPNAIPFGKAQKPELWDYADGVDTMKFLLGLKS